MGRTLRAERLSPAQLDALAAVQPGDVQRAAAQWRADAPAPYRNLLDARPEPSATPAPAGPRAWP